MAGISNKRVNDVLAFVAPMLRRFYEAGREDQEPRLGSNTPVQSNKTSSEAAISAIRAQQGVMEMTLGQVRSFSDRLGKALVVCDQLSAQLKERPDRSSHPRLYTEAEVTLAIGQIINERTQSAIPPKREDLRAQYHFTQRQGEVLELIAEGLTSREIGSRLCLSEDTVNFHAGELLKKLGSNNRTRLAVKAIRIGLIE